MLTKKTQKNACKYKCDSCIFVSSNKHDYMRHLSTLKHQMLTNANEISVRRFECTCGKSYQHKASLSRHKKQCNIEEKQTMNIEDINLEEINSDDDSPIDLRKAVKTILKQQALLMDELPKLGNITNNTNNTNHFNLNIFLNETCKNAITFDDFMDRLFLSR